MPLQQNSSLSEDKNYASYLLVCLFIPCLLPHSFLRSAHSKPTHSGSTHSSIQVLESTRYFGINVCISGGQCFQPYRKIKMEIFEGWPMKCKLTFLSQLKPVDWEGVHNPHTRRQDNTTRTCHRTAIHISAAPDPLNLLFTSFSDVCHVQPSRCGTLISLFFLFAIVDRILSVVLSSSLMFRYHGVVHVSSLPHISSDKLLLFSCDHL